jgi:2-haloacid dehalogenase
MGDDAAMERFLAEVCTPDWNRRQDAGRTWTEAVETLASEHPDQRELIVAYRERWDEMLGGAIEGTVAVLAELRDRGLPLYALSNWSDETWRFATDRYAFLDWFDAIVISGEAGVAKPDPRIYRLLIDRTGLDPTTTVFIDDVPANVEAGRSLGFIGVIYADPPRLRHDLVGLGLLD